MKTSILLPVSIAVATCLVFVVCKTGKKHPTDGWQLPASCTLLAMSPQNRAAHQRRLDTLTRSALLESQTPKGFVFTVDLRRMSVEDLHLWMENEQKCCSFLRMTSRAFQKEGVAEVTVTCPVVMRAAVMRAFGLQSKQKALDPLPR
ncbi:hypothetical protein GC207_12940 [bacterium]|nr:hypothetical protein [bacterium]